MVVSESTDMEDVSPSTAITTNFIGQKTEKLGADMCERSCEELSTMFQELKGLRVVVGNLIDGLQKVVCTVVLQSGRGSGKENKKIVHYLSNKARRSVEYWPYITNKLVTNVIRAVKINVLSHPWYTV